MKNKKPPQIVLYLVPDSRHGYDIKRIHSLKEKYPEGSLYLKIDSGVKLTGLILSSVEGFWHDLRHRSKRHWVMAYMPQIYAWLDSHGLKRPRFAHIKRLQHTDPSTKSYAIIASKGMLCYTGEERDIGDMIERPDSMTPLFRTVNVLSIGIDHDDAAGKWLREHS